MSFLFLYNHDLLLNNLQKKIFTDIKFKNVTSQPQKSIHVMCIM